MPLKVLCSQGHRLTVPIQRAGTAVRCPICNEKVQIPAESPAAAEKEEFDPLAYLEEEPPPAKATPPKPVVSKIEPKPESPPPPTPKEVKKASKQKEDIDALSFLEDAPPAAKPVEQPQPKPIEKPAGVPKPVAVEKPARAPIEQPATAPPKPETPHAAELPRKLQAVYPAPIPSAPEDRQLAIPEPPPPASVEKPRVLPEKPAPPKPISAQPIPEDEPPVSNASRERAAPIASPPPTPAAIAPLPAPAIKPLERAAAAPQAPAAIAAAPAPRSAPAPIPPPTPAELPGIEHRPDQVQKVFYLALLLAALALFNLAPAAVDLFDYLRARMEIAATPGLGAWVYCVFLIGLMQLAYAVYAAQLPDWSSMWVVAVLCLLVAVVYAGVLAMFMLGAVDNSPLASLGLTFLVEQRRTMSVLWCLSIVSLNGLLTFFAGQMSYYWHRTTLLVPTPAR